MRTVHEQHNIDLVKKILTECNNTIFCVERGRTGKGEIYLDFYGVVHNNSTPKLQGFNSNWRMTGMIATGFGFKYNNKKECIVVNGDNDVVGTIQRELGINIHTETLE